MEGLSLSALSGLTSAGKLEAVLVMAVLEVLKGDGTAEGLEVFVKGLCLETEIMSWRLGGGGGWRVL